MGSLDFGSKPLPVFEHHTGWVRSVVNLDQTNIVSAGFDGKIFMKDVVKGTTREAPAALDLAPHRSRWIAITQTNKIVAAVGDVRGMQSENGKGLVGARMTAPFPPAGPPIMLLAPPGAWHLSSARRSPYAGVWNIKTNETFTAWTPALPRDLTWDAEAKFLFAWCGAALPPRSSNTQHLAGHTAHHTAATNRGAVEPVSALAAPRAATAATMALSTNTLSTA